MASHPTRQRDINAVVRLPATKRKALLVLDFMGVDNGSKDSPTQAAQIFGRRLIREESLVDMYFLLQNKLGPTQHSVQKRCALGAFQNQQAVFMGRREAQPLR